MDSHFRGLKTTYVAVCGKVSKYERNLNKRFHSIETDIEKVRQSFPKELCIPSPKIFDRLENEIWALHLVPQFLPHVFFAPSFSAKVFFIFPFRQAIPFITVAILSLRVKNQECVVPRRS